MSSTKALIEYFIPEDGDVLEHPNVYTIPKKIDSITLGDIIEVSLLLVSLLVIPLVLPHPRNLLFPFQECFQEDLWYFITQTSFILFLCPNSLAWCHGSQPGRPRFRKHHCSQGFKNCCCQSQGSLSQEVYLASYSFSSHPLVASTPTPTKKPTPKQTPSPTVPKAPAKSKTTTLKTTPKHSPAVSPVLKPATPTPVESSSFMDDDIFDNLVSPTRTDSWRFLGQSRHHSLQACGSERTLWFGLLYVYSLFLYLTLSSCSKPFKAFNSFSQVCSNANKEVFL